MRASGDRRDGEVDLDYPGSDHPTSDAPGRFEAFDLDGDSRPELLRFSTRIDGPARAHGEVTVWGRDGRGEPMEWRRVSWLLSGAESLADVAALAPTLRRFVAPTPTSRTEDLVLRLQTARPSDLRSLAAAGGVTFCDVMRSRYVPGHRRCRRIRLRDLPDEEVLPVVLSGGVRPTPVPSLDEGEGESGARWVWFDDPMDRSTLGLGESPGSEISPPRPVCVTRGARQVCVVNVYGDEHFVLRLEWVFVGVGHARRLLEMNRSLRDYRGE